MKLVPIRVWMILSVLKTAVAINACPHTRGDDPIHWFAVVLVMFLSPYAWG